MTYIHEHLHHDIPTRGHLHHGIPTCPLENICITANLQGYIGITTHLQGYICIMAHLQGYICITAHLQRYIYITTYLQRDICITKIASMKGDMCIIWTFRIYIFVKSICIRKENSRLVSHFVCIHRKSISRSVVKSLSIAC